MPGTTVQIGYWIEKTTRREKRCPSYYAADFEILETKPGRYPLNLLVTTGYTCPMPYWLLGSIDAQRVAGELYSGFGGVNFASTPMALEPAPLHLQANAYHLNDLVAAGIVELDPQWSGLLVDRIAFARSLEWGKGLLSTGTWIDR